MLIPDLDRVIIGCELRLEALVEEPVATVLEEGRSAVVCVVRMATLHCNGWKCGEDNGTCL